MPPVVFTIRISNEHAAGAAEGLPSEPGWDNEQILQAWILDQISIRYTKAQTTAIMSPRQDDLEAHKQAIKENQGNNPQQP